MTIEELNEALDEETQKLREELPANFEAFGRYVYQYKDVTSYHHNKSEIDRILERCEQIENFKRKLNREVENVGTREDGDSEQKG